MAWVTKEWLPRLAEFIGRRKFTNVATGEIFYADIERAEGAVSQEGDAFSPANMNDLEQRIADEFTAINQSLTITISKGASDTLTNYGSYVHSGVAYVDMDYVSALTTLASNSQTAGLSAIPKNTTARIPCIYRNSSTGDCINGFVKINSSGTLYSQETTIPTGYNQISLHCSYLIS